MTFAERENNTQPSNLSGASVFGFYCGAIALQAKQKNAFCQAPDTPDFSQSHLPLISKIV
ncbi:hypothetical protein IQ270_20680 [Microcoleus sp. LEGE 07076]|uniref:hypothetical protein n=1 Tax=Microcoleus sp. LEGE 07076 TaxID=915322 RepID=UPI00187EAF3F|nr:hypothetical protein [Microcoleus sp. LEGE 07076]MBE9187004.1 hypothetical protein [Microcoleus sp. LEGE 07076]